MPSKVSTQTDEDHLTEQEVVYRRARLSAWLGGMAMNPLTRKVVIETYAGAH
jgi:hypothetical protein